MLIIIITTIINNNKKDPLRTMLCYRLPRTDASESLQHYYVKQSFSLTLHTAHNSISSKNTCNYVLNGNCITFPHVLS